MPLIRGFARNFSMRLGGHAILITGGSAGIGLAFARGVGS